MSDPKLKFTLTWGDMTLELKGDAASVLRELETLKASGIGKLAEFFALRSCGSGANLPSPQPSPAPTPQQPGPAPGPAPGPSPAPGGGTPETPPAPHGDFFRYAFDQWIFPSSASQAVALAGNIDNDPMQRPDNQFGQILVAVTQQGVDMSGQPLGVGIGSVAPLLRLQTIDPMLQNDASASVVLTRGPRVGPSGFAPDADAGPALFFGQLTAGQFISDPRWVPASLDVTIPGPLAMQFTAIKPRIRFRASATGLADGALQGAIPADVFKSAFLSAFAQLIADEVANDPNSQMAATLISLFAPGVAPGTPISIDQWRQALEGNSLMETLLRPDVVLDGQPAVSFGIGFTASPTNF